MGWGWHWIRPQSESMCVQDGVIQTCSKCVSPHERREQNGIKLDQERVYFSKRKQDGGHWSIGYNASTLLFLGSILWIALVRALCRSSRFSLIHYSCFPSGALPPWQIGFHSYAGAHAFTHMQIMMQINTRSDHPHTVSNCLFTSRDTTTIAKCESNKLLQSRSNRGIQRRLQPFTPIGGRHKLVMEQ